MYHSISLNETNEDIKVDLHMHTNASDGTWSPLELVTRVLEAGIKLFAVTDHDTTKNLADVSALAKTKGLMFIPGVEVNTTYKERNYHVLGLGIDASDKALQNLLTSNIALMTHLDYDSIKALEKVYSCLTLEEFLQYDKPLGRGGWKALNYVIDKGLCKSYKDYFKLFEGNNISLDKVKFAPSREVIDTIIQAGGVPILAHPGAEFYDKDYKAIVSSMVSEGIMGIECFHPNNSPEITEYCIDTCKKNNLLITGGSDCHGDFVTNRRLGHPSINLSQLILNK